jgi:hypothetical protein
MPFASVVSEEKPETPPAPPPLAAMGVSEAVLKRREYHRQWERQHPGQVRTYYQRKYAKHKDAIKAKRRAPERRAKLRDYLKGYRRENAERLRLLNRAWLEENPEHVRAYRVAYGPRRRALYEDRKEEICARNRELAHTEPYLERVRAYQRRRRREDPLFSLVGALRASTSRAFRRAWVKKPARTEALLGCTIAQAKAHIEAQFVNGMTWQDRRSFVIDHHVPIAAFDLRDAEEVALAFCWRNLRPLTQRENATKSATLPSPLPAWLPGHIAARLLAR